MPTSYNGWPASPNPDALGAKWFEVPGVPNRRFLVVEVAHPLFKYLIRRFDAEIDPLPGGVMDEWSFSYRKGRATSSLSCHASATAVDLDATQFPMGRSNMTEGQEAGVERILSSCRKQFRWGGWFSPAYCDQMHFELANGTSKTSVKAAIAAMALHPDGRVLWPDDIGRDHQVRVKLLKKALAQVGYYPKRLRYSGKWNPKLTQAWMLWKARKPRETAQLRLDALGAQTRLF